MSYLEQSWQAFYCLEVPGGKDTIFPILDVNIIEAFSEEQADLPAEYDEQLVRQLIERLTIFDEKATVRFKSGVKINVEK